MEDVKWRSDSEILSQIGDKIKEWRLEANISQKQLAQKSGISLFTEQQMEYGCNSSLANLLRVLRTLDRLGLFALFFESRQISPIEYDRMSKHPERQRASKKTTRANDKDIDNEPLW